MRPSALALLLLWGCIDDPAATADPETTDAGPDAALDSNLINQCTAVPVCPAGTRPAVDCSATDCVTVEACGDAIECAPCDPSPPCPGDTIPVEACPPDLPCVPPINSCGEVVECLPLTCLCPDGMPAQICPPDESCDPLPACAGPVGCLGAPCTIDCPLPVDDCLEADPFCDFVEDCGVTQACLDPEICGPGGQPYCPPDAIYAPDCAPDDPRCIEVTACGGTHRCRLPCPVHTRPVDGCLPADPMCWVIDGQACLVERCQSYGPAWLCEGLNLLPVEVCNDAEPCEVATFCGATAQCQGERGPCEDGLVDCGPGRRLGQCQPDGRACEPVYGCGTIGACIDCDPDEECL